MMLKLPEMFSAMSPRQTERKAPVVYRDRNWVAPIPRKHRKGRVVRAIFIGDRSKYQPHQGKKECERRRRQKGAV